MFVCGKFELNDACFFFGFRFAIYEYHSIFSLKIGQWCLFDASFQLSFHLLKVLFSLFLFHFDLHL